MDFIFFLITMFLLCEIAEYDKSKYHLIIMFGGLVSMLPQLETLLDFDLVYAYPVLFGSLVLIGNRIRIVARNSKHMHDPDEEL